MTVRNVVILAWLIPMSLYSQAPVGTWKTIDDNTGEERSYVQIYQEDGKLFGKIIKLLDDDPPEFCEECKGEKYNAPMIGLVILESLEQVGQVWKKGIIMDPENGNSYKCSIWLDEGNLRVKGKHWTGLSRTQTWYRVEGN